MKQECGCSSVVERQLPKLNVVGSIPITRSNNSMSLKATLEIKLRKFFASLSCESLENERYRVNATTQTSEHLCDCSVLHHVDCGWLSPVVA
jgi:hypothetical protein